MNTQHLTEQEATEVAKAQTSRTYAAMGYHDTDPAGALFKRTASALEPLHNTSGARLAAPAHLAGLTYCKSIGWHNE